MSVLIKENQINIKNLNLDELENYIKNFGKEKYRAKQIFSWLYKKNVYSFDEMTDVSKKLREQLKNKAYIEKLCPENILKDEEDGTLKFLIKLRDSNHIETVVIHDNGRNTVCVSTQIGCQMNCKFCTTAKAVEFKRNLTTSEIIEQILLSKRILSENNQKLSNVVFMGMGEPFENYTNVLKSCFILSSDFGLGLGGNRITISTCGIIPGIYKLADCPSRYELAVSLNAPCEKIRTQIMPITKKYKFDELIKSLKYYNQKKPKNYITLEYVMLKNITDTEQCLNDLVKLCKKLKCKINLIRFNPTEFVNMKPSSKERMEFFFEFLNKNKIRTFTRKSKGKNISGACGQLAGKNKFNKE